MSLSRVEKGRSALAAELIDARKVRMGDVSFSKAILPSAFLCGAMAAAAFVVSILSGMDGSSLPAAYLLPAAAVAIVSVLIWVFIRTFRLALDRAPDPAAVLKAEFPRRVQLLILPVLIAPLFFASFTTVKSGMGRLTDFGWDKPFADLDAAIFQVDPWLLTHRIFGPVATGILEFFYTVGWGIALAFTSSLIAIYASRRFAGTFFLAMLLTWMVAGFFFAYLLSSSGPVFVHLTDPGLQPRFAPLLSALDQLLSPASSIRWTQTYLASAIDSAVAVKGGGISAMPSVHIGVAAIFIMAARGTGWIWIAVPFMLVIWIGSVHFGYHYAVDGALAVPIAIGCWLSAEAVYRGQKDVREARVAPAE